MSFGGSKEAMQVNSLRYSRGMVALGTSKCIQSVSFNVVTGTAVRKKIKSVSGVEFPPEYFCQNRNYTNTQF